MPWSAATRRANKATAGDLAVSVPPTRVICDKNFSFSIQVTSDICDDQCAQVWRMLEENMHELYRSSSFGWNPQKKRKEMFDPRSRIVIVRDVSDLPGSDVIGYSIFRFEREDRQDVVYCYELQVSKESRRLGLGRLLVQTLSDIGAQWGMTKVLLTVFKANHAAMLFYRSTGFTIDESSPDFSNDSEGEDEYDYSIMSRCIP
ncbi:acyl-CoA N-acyltransferase [Imleria badia]|nr:acyl-CoA N-acyltransferase [Imleria badia]